MAEAEAQAQAQAQAQPEAAADVAAEVDATLFETLVDNDCLFLPRPQNSNLMTLERWEKKNARLRLRLRRFGFGFGFGFGFWKIIRWGCSWSVWVANALPLWVHHWVGHV